MIRVVALTPGRRVPSARFRVRQYLPDLRRAGIEVAESVPLIGKYARLPGWPDSWSQIYAAPFFVAWQGLKLACRAPGIARSRTGGITWLHRDLLPGVPTLEGLLGQPLVFDADDAVWLKPPLGASVTRRIASRARVVLAGNEYVADWFSSWTQDVRIVPTAVDCQRFCPPDAARADRPFTVGWTGSASNFRYLLQIAQPLRRFLLEHSDARFLVMAERRPSLDLPPDQVEFLPWTERKEVEAVQRMDVGLMPLADEPWARGKCSFKMLQYMACGVPAVVSPVGMNREVLSLGELGFSANDSGEWVDALEDLYRDRDKARELGKEGRRLAIEHFDVPLIAEQLGRVFRWVAD